MTHEQERQIEQLQTTHPSTATRLARAMDLAHTARRYADWDLGGNDVQDTARQIKDLAIAALRDAEMAAVAARPDLFPRFAESAARQDR